MRKWKAHVESFVRALSSDLIFKKKNLRFFNGIMRQKEIFLEKAFKKFFWKLYTKTQRKKF